MANSFPYKFKENYQSSSCVYKIVFGEAKKKYFIWKALALKQGVAQVMKDLGRKVTKGTDDTDYFLNVVNYIRRGRILSCTIEVILFSDNHKELIDCENDQLKNRTPECLNGNFEAYIPRWITLTQNKAHRDTISKPDVQTPTPQKEIQSESPPYPLVTKLDLSNQLGDRNPPKGQKNKLTAAEMEEAMRKIGG